MDRSGDFFQEGGQGVGAKLGGVKGCGGQVAQGAGNFLWRDGVKFCGGFADKHIGERGAAGNGGDAALCLEACGGDATIFVEEHGEAQHVSADGICHFDGGGRAGQITGVAGIAEVVEDDVGEHEFVMSRINNGCARILDKSRAALSIMPRARKRVLGIE
jgi:hypothetical protein